MESYAETDGFDMTWLISQALMNSLCLQGQEEESLQENCLDGEPSAPLSGNNTQQAYCAPDKMTKFSRLSRFGMTYKPLTESRGEELLTLYLADFHARTSAQRGGGQELPESDQVCGSTWQGSLARLDPDTLLWKTAQCSLLEDLELSLQTFPRWGSMQNGALYQLPILVQTISVKEFGSEPNNETFFHTPNTTGLDGGSNGRKALKKRMWLTPRVVEVDESPENFRRRMNGKRQNDRKNGFGSLTMQVKWPTPMSTEHKANRQTRENHQNGLTQAVLATETGGQLNPTWVEFLMGWPLGFTDLKPLEMDKSLYVQQLHGSYSNE
jgi:hypothetical protein